MAAEIVRNAMRIIGVDRQVILCCDSWYPKASVVHLVDEFDNLAIIANVRSDTVIYELPPVHNGRRGRPRVKGEKLSIKNIVVQDIPDTDYNAGSKTVVTELFGNRPVNAIVTDLNP